LKHSSSSKKCFCEKYASAERNELLNFMENVGIETIETMNVGGRFPSDYHSQTVK
jgi:hypothetical protein